MVTGDSPTEDHWITTL